MREYWPARRDAAGNITQPERTMCHYFLKNGEIEFLGDSTEHELRGKHPLPDFPNSDQYRLG